MYGFGEGATELYIASGSSDDWAHLSGIMLSYTVELRDTGQYAFLLPEEQIEPMCAENMEGLRAIYEYIQPKPACNASLCHTDSHCVYNNEQNKIECVCKRNQ